MKKLAFLVVLIALTFTVAALPAASYAGDPDAPSGELLGDPDVPSGTSEIGDPDAPSGTNELGDPDAPSGTVTIGYFESPVGAYLLRLWFISGLWFRAH